MKIAVISDTHIPATAASLGTELVRGIKGADLIIHAGDFTEESVIADLKKIAPIECVAGNMDSYAIKKMFPEKKIINAGIFKIGIIHGSGAPDKMIDYAKEAFKGMAVDCIIHGHSHIAHITAMDNIIYFCPGSPTDRVFAPYTSYGIIEIGNEITPKIVRL
jgi:uncharacterized protein